MRDGSWLISPYLDVSVTMLYHFFLEHFNLIVILVKYNCKKSLTLLSNFK